ncbi:MAG: LamG-like jellyroll fold domain-containing protein [Bacteroidales bacterium]|jgi:hypothetical protein
MADAYADYVKLLMRFDGANNSTVFTDESQNHFVPVVTGSPVISTTQSKFGSSSLYLNGSSWLTIGNTNRFTETGDFCIEFWFYGPSKSFSGLVTQGSSHSVFNALTMMSNPGSESYVGEVINGSFNWVMGGNNVIPANTWTHFAYSRSGTNCRVFINGSLVSNLILAVNTLTCDTPLSIGYGPTWGNCIGYIDDLRITVGVPRYTANFTPVILDTLDVTFNINMYDGTEFKVPGINTPPPDPNTFTNNNNDLIETLDITFNINMYDGTEFKFPGINTPPPDPNTFTNNNNDLIETLYNITDSRTYYSLYALNYTYNTALKNIKDVAYFERITNLLINDVDNNYDTRKLNGVIDLFYTYSNGFNLFISTYRANSKNINDKVIENNYFDLSDLNQNILGYTFASEINPFNSLNTCDYTRIAQIVSPYTVKGNMNTEYNAPCKKIYVLDSNNDLEHLILPNSLGYYNLYVPDNTELYTFCFIPPSECVEPKWYYNVNGIIQ